MDKAKVDILFKKIKEINLESINKYKTKIKKITLKLTTNIFLIVLITFKLDFL